MRLSSIRSSVLTAAALLAVSAVSMHAQQPYKVVDQWKIGGVGGWDYLLADPADHRLYITHATRVEVMDTTTGKSVGAITGLKGTHGIALDPDGKTGYITDGGANALVIFDRTTLATIGSVPAGTNPDGIAYEPVTKTVWTFNGRSADATVIDTKTRTAIATIKLSGKPEFPQVDGKGNVFVNIEDKNSLVKLSATDKKVMATWPLAGCESPSGQAIDKANHRTFSVCDGKKMAVTDIETGKQLALATIGDGPDAANFSVAHNVAFSSNGDGTLSIVDAKDYKTIETLPTRKGGRTMSYDESADRAYVVCADYLPAPAPTATNPKPRPTPVPDSFMVLVIGRK